MTELRIILLVAGVAVHRRHRGFEWWRARRSRPLAASVRATIRPGTVRRARDAAPAARDQRGARAARRGARQRCPSSNSRSAERVPRARDSGGIADLATTLPSIAPIRVARTSRPTQAICRAHNEPYIGQDDEISAVRVIEDNEPRRTVPQLVAGLARRSRAPDRHAARVAARRAAFRGRALRQAFGSAGFWHGPLDIYHLPDAEGRVVLSAAALAQPGTFDPSIMDSQRFSGLNLFAVLPGPLPERETFDELVHARAALAERLDGHADRPARRGAHAAAHRAAAAIARGARHRARRRRVVSRAPVTAAQRVAQLRDEINGHDHRYYVLNEPAVPTPSTTG